MQKIDRGDLRTEIGLVFEVATIAGVPLFDPEPAALPAHRARIDTLLMLLPQRVRGTAEDERVDDAF